jgi:hypothetical protein
MVFLVIFCPRTDYGVLKAQEIPLNQWPAWLWLLEPLESEMQFRSSRLFGYLGGLVAVARNAASTAPEGRAPNALFAARTLPSARQSLY